MSWRFLNDLKTRYRAGALKDLAEVKAIAKEDGIEDLKPWDVGYYSEKLQHRKFEFSSEDARPYFPLGPVLEGTFAHFSKLFGLKVYPCAGSANLAFGCDRL
jgi:Zn-dependent oligopeptidase